MTKQISPVHGQSGSPSLSFGEQSCFGSSLSFSMGLLHDPFFLPVEATICTGTSGQLQLFKDIIICKWCSVARDPDCLGIYSKDVHGTEPATHGILALLCSVYSSFSAIDLCFNSLSGDSASLYVCDHIQKIEYHSGLTV